MTFHHGKTCASTTFTNRTIILRKWTLCEKCLSRAQDNLCVHNRPTERTIRHTIGKLENNLTLLDDTRPIRPRTARTVENTAAVNDSFAEDPEESIRRRSQQLGLSYGSTWAIFDAGN